MKKYITLCAALVLPSCLEAQPAPDLKTIASTNFQIEIVAGGLDTPWGVTSMPGGGYLVTEKGGNLKRVWADGRIENIKGLPKDIFTQQQAGLFDVVLSPNSPDTVYLSYASGTAAANTTAIFKAELPRPGTSDGAEGLTLTNGEVIFEADPVKDTGSHFGGRIVFLPDNTFILTLGDGFAYREAAQDKSSHLGKIVRLNQDGSASQDNPFYETSPFVYSYGHRNVQGAHYDAPTQTLWAHEHGPRGGDELNIITSGANYGWPLATTGVDYNGAKITPFTAADGTQSYVKDWVPSIAPSGLTIYRGDMFPEWNGDALVGGLAAKSLRRVDLDGNTYIGEEILLADVSARIRDVRTAPDGAVLVLTNMKKDGVPAGQLLRITPK